MSELQTMVVGLAVAGGGLFSAALVVRARHARDVVKPLAQVTAFVLGISFAAAYGLPPLLSFVARSFPQAESADLVVLTGGLTLLSAAFGTTFVIDVRRQRRWPSVRGEVVSSEVEHYRVLQPGGGSSGAMFTLHRPAVVYRYVIAGRSYESRCIVRGVTVGTANPDPAERFVRHHPRGASITLRYDPSDPAQSILELPWLGVVVPWLLAVGFAALCSSLSGYFRHT